MHPFPLFSCPLAPQPHNYSLSWHCARSFFICLHTEPLLQNVACGRQMSFTNDQLASDSSSGSFVFSSLLHFTRLGVLQFAQRELLSCPIGSLFCHSHHVFSWHYTVAALMHFSSSAIFQPSPHRFSVSLNSTCYFDLTVSCHLEGLLVRALRYQLLVMRLTVILEPS